MEHSKALGLADFLAEFYQKIWNVIKSYILVLFVTLHAGQLELFFLNFHKIILLPKVKEAERI
jgi:hypothetical protein